MKYIITSILVIVALIFTTNTNSEFFSMWIIAMPLALLCARGVHFRESSTQNRVREKFMLVKIKYELKKMRERK